MQQHSAFRGNLGDLQSWHLHAWSHDSPFPEWAPALAQLVAAGRYPGLQQGDYDLRLDRPRSRRAWQSLLPGTEQEAPARKKQEVAFPVGPQRKETAANNGARAPLAVIVPIRNRAGRRVRNALHSLNWQENGPPAQIVVVSQGSRPAVNEELHDLCSEAGARLIVTGRPEAPWNKSLALNMGIRAVRPEIPYLMTMDIDMILAPDFFAVALQRLQQEPPVLVLCRSLDLPQEVVLPEPPSLQTAFDHLRQQARPRARSGTGGIQAAHRDFFYRVRGYDEDLLWWGAMDGDMVKRARLAGLAIAWIDDKTSMLHQWHPRKHHSLDEHRHVAQARIAWQRNHQIVRQRAHTLCRNPDGWGGSRHYE